MGAPARARPRRHNTVPARTGPPTFKLEGGHLVARNERLEVVFDGTTGGIRSVVNRLTKQQLLNAPEEAPAPWRMTAQNKSDDVVTAPTNVIRPSSSPLGPPAGNTQTFTPEAFKHELLPGGQDALLRWETGQDGVRLEVRAALPHGGDLELWPTLINDRNSAGPNVVTYPILASPATFSDGGAEDELIHPQSSTGYLYRTPLDQSVPNQTECYPDGFSGLSMQVLGYYRRDVGGFYLASHDPHATLKWIHFGSDAISWGHQSWDLRNGAGMDLDYPVVIGPLTRGDWYEAAEKYRVWGLRQWWCAAGPKWARDDSEYARWLHEEVGLTLWAVPSQRDWSPWIDFYGRMAGTAMQIVPAYDWSATRSWQKGFDGYFPAKFHPNNLKAFKGHRVTPYMNDLFVSEQSEDFATKWEPAQMLPLHPPQHPFPLGIFCYVARPRADEAKDGQADPNVATDLVHFLCPVHPAQKALHTWRDKTLIEETGFDGVMYDISFANTENWNTCHRGEHGHPPGAGRWMNDHYLENAVASKRAMSKVLGRYAVSGTETINETCLAVADCHYSRAVAGPHAVLEGRGFPAPFEDEPGGGVEAVPFFDAVYHDYGPVRQDGYAQLNPAYGDSFYWIAARQVLLFGGLLDLDYNLYWPEAFPGYDGKVEPTYTPYDGGYWTPREVPEFDAAKGAFVREVAQARVSFGNPWLGYGRVARPTEVKSETIALDYANHRDAYPQNSMYAQGDWHVPQLFQAAWFDKDDRLGLFFVNLAKEGTFSLKVDVDAGERWGQDLRGRRLELASLSGTKVIGKVGSDNHVRFAVDLPPRKIFRVAVLGGERRKRVR